MMIIICFQVRLMYKRVPMNKPAHIRNLDDPIVEYIHLYRPDQEHFLINLPRGKYIVCADYTMTEAHSGKKVVLQHDCFETTVDRLDNNSESKDLIINRILYTDRWLCFSKIIDF